MLLPRAALHLLNPQPVLTQRGCLDSRLCTWPCWTSRSSQGPASWAWPGASREHSFPPGCQPHQTAQCHQQTWVRVIPLQCHQQRYQTVPVLILIPGNATCHWSPLGHWATDLNSSRVTIQPIPYWPTNPSIKSTSLQFSDKNVVWDTVKCFAQANKYIQS